MEGRWNGHREGRKDGRGGLVGGDEKGGDRERGGEGESVTAGNILILTFFFPSALLCENKHPLSVVTSITMCQNTHLHTAKN